MTGPDISPHPQAISRRKNLRYVCHLTARMLAFHLFCVILVKTVLPGLSFLVRELTKGFNGHRNSLLPLPEKKSACRRLSLFLRWMVREDRVDPGGWQEVPPRKLIVPVDTHMYRICIQLHLTERRSAGMPTAIEITRAFREIEPEDPVRYHFALTRLGIRKDTPAYSLNETKLNHPHPA